MDGVGSNVKVVESSRRVRYREGILRFLGLLLTLIASIVTVVDKETKTIPVSISKTVPTLHVPVTAKWHYMSAFVYFVSNAIAFSYATASLGASMAVWSSKEKSTIVLVILDIAMMGLLFSANGAAIAVGLLSRDVNSHVQWQKVCNGRRRLLSPNDSCDNLVVGWIFGFLLAWGTGHSQSPQEIKVDRS